MPNNLSRFWQELKRRNVVRVITVYAGAAFVTIELINNINEPLRLPEWTPTLVIVLLAIGFPVVIIFSWIYDVHPEGGVVKTETATKGKTEDVPESSNGWKIASYISFVVIVGLIALNIFGGKKGSRIDESLALSIAVLPFDNYSGDPGQDYMCEGLTDEILNDLFKMASFDEMRPASSVRPYQNSELGSKEIAETLQVNYLVGGSYKKMGEDLKITAYLIEAKNDKYIWSQDYVISYSKIMGIPGDIALQIANNLKAFISEDVKQSIDRMPTDNFEAYELMQQVKSIFNAIPFQNRATIIDLADKAIALDPDYADPFAWKGTMIIADGFFWGTREMSKVAWEAEKYLDKALRIDPNNFMANWGMSCIDLFVKWDYVHMVEISEKIRAQLSSDININWATALFQLKMGMYKEALSSNGPDGRPDITMFSQILLGNKDYARNMMERLIDSLGSASYTTAAEVCIWLQDFDQAMFYIDSVIASGMDPEEWWPKQQAGVAVAYFKTGRPDLARALIRKLIERSDTTSVGSPMYFIGWYYSWIGELDSAFYWLDEAVENRSSEVSWLKVDPAFKSLQEDPRYLDLYERTGHKDFDDYMAGKEE